ncbi:MAG: molybdopterin molybdotransferase MoeA [Legionella longbeachae]|nr:molybdopterin molybdotransferase MoeA [Legionella longbeachae]
MISYHEALMLLLDQQYRLNIECINLIDSLGRVLGEDLYAPISLPSYDNSAMDGYSLVAEETQDASEDNPIWFIQSACIGAGEFLKKTTHAPKSTVEIMTGAPVPHPFNAVIPVEKTLRNNSQAPQMIGITHALSVGENIRYSGEDIYKNTFLLAKGEEINSQRIMTLSGLGFQQIPVFKKVKILVLATGKEVVIDGTIDTRFQLHDCNTPFLQTSLLNDLKCEVTTDHLFCDTDDEFITLINKQLNHVNCPNIIISTGAVSAGKYDFIPRSLRTMGAKIIFHKVAIRPGKPILFAVFPNGTFYFGLPGNPSAVAAGFRFFVYPLFRLLQKMPAEKPIFAKLKQTTILKAPLCFFQKAYHYIDDNGCSCVDILPGQASFMISPMLKANAWVLINQTPSTIEKDTLVPVYLMRLIKI